MPKTTKELFADYTASRVNAIRNNPLCERKLSSCPDVLSACQNVYDSGIIFAQGGAAAKRKGTPCVNEILNDIATRIYNYLSNPDNSQISMEEFDVFHNRLCSDFLYALNKARASVGYVELHYGSAQKFINMAFKYLSCYSDFHLYKDYFKWCHMPIDTVILKWIKDNYNIGDIEYYVYVDKKGKSTLSATYKNTSWTKFDVDKYKKLLNIIREKVLNDDRFSRLSLLDAEFAAWE